MSSWAVVVQKRGQGTDMEVSAGSRPRPSTVPALLGAAHPGPALAVTVLAALLATALEMPRPASCW